jgi:hypothetical protein
MSVSFYLKASPFIFRCFSAAPQREIHEHGFPPMNSDTTSASSRRQIACRNKFTAKGEDFQAPAWQPRAGFLAV